ncbi:MAG: methyltransferase, partial [Ilumatobacter sp.]
GEEGARSLIARAFDALRPGGRLLLADYFPDMERKANPHAVIMGTTMMASTERGFTFTHREFSEWLRAAGFRSIRLIEPIGFQQTFVAERPLSSSDQTTQTGD